MQLLQSAFGVFAILAIAWLFSEQRRAVGWRQVGIALAVTVVTAVILLKVPAVVAAFAYVNQAVGAIAAATRAGTSFVFGYLGGGTLPYDLKVPGAEFVLALQALPVLLVMSVLTTLLFYWRIMPPVVRGFSWALERTIGVGGAVGLATATNIFVGHVEAPLFIRPYLARLTRSELFIVMTGGMAGIAGTVLVLYATMLAPGGPRCRRAFRDRLGAGRTGGDPDQPRHGAGNRGPARPPANSSSRSRWRRAPWMPSSKAPSRDWNCCSPSAPC